MQNQPFVLDSRILPPNGTRQESPPFHPSRGGNSYSDDMRQMVIEMYLRVRDARRQAIEGDAHGRVGDDDAPVAVLAGGIESMSNVPHYLPSS